jgi:hypothetical protein
MLLAAVLLFQPPSLTPASWRQFEDRATSQRAIFRVVRRVVWRWVRDWPIWRHRMYESLTFGGVTPEKIALARVRLAEAGFNLQDDAGDVDAKGYKVRYAINRDAGTITLILLSKPWYVPTGALKRKLTEYLAAEGIVPILETRA